MFPHSVKASVTMPDGTNNNIEFFLSKDTRRSLAGLPTNEQFKQIQNLLGDKLCFSPAASIHTIYTKYSFVDEKFHSKYNTIIDFNIPYVLHIPNTGYQLKFPQECVVHTNKVWTVRTKGSDNIDAISDVATYYRDSNLTTPIMPFSPELGRELDIENGVNVEKIREESGSLRYTNFQIEIDSDLTTDFLEDSVNNLIAKIINIINYIIEHYKLSTEEYFMRPLSRVFINTIYLPQENMGLYILNQNIKGAMINYSRDRLNNFANKLSGGIVVSKHRLLLSKKPQNTPSACCGDEWGQLNELRSLKID